MANKIPYKHRIGGPVPLGGWGTVEEAPFNPFEGDNPYKKDMNPAWAKLLFKGIGKRDKLKKNVRSLKDDPSLLFKGILGKSLLDKHINPFFNKILPDSAKLDVLRRQIRFQPHDRFNMTLGKKGRGAKLDLNWRF